MRTLDYVRQEQVMSSEWTDIKGSALLKQPYAEELNEGGLPYVTDRHGFRRWGIPNIIVRADCDDVLRALLSNKHVDAAVVFVDDDNNREQMAVVKHRGECNE